MPRVEVKKVIPGKVEEVYRLCRDIASFPRFMQNVKKIEILERGPDWQLTAWEAVLQGRTFRWKEREEFDHRIPLIRYRQVEGDLKQFEGEWRFVPADGGTEVTLTCEFALGIPLLEPVLHPLATLAVRQNVEAMLGALEKRARAQGG